MKNVLHKLLISLFLLTLAACNKEDVMQKFATPEDQQVAKMYISHLQQKRFDEIEKVIDPTLKDTSLHDSLEKMAALLPAGDPTVVTLVGAHKTYQGEYSTTNLTYEYGYPGLWIITNVAVKSQAGQLSIIGISVTPQTTSIEEQTRFSFSGKSAMQYLILLLAVVFTILTLVALTICVRMKLKGRKWPWVLFILFGFGNLSVNWSTGAIGFAPIAIQMFSASASAAFYGPWIISISLPLGAVCFLIFRKNHAAEVNVPAETQSEAI